MANTKELVGLASFFQETNTFVRNPRVTTRKEFLSGEGAADEELIDRHRGKGTQIGGIIEAAEEREVTLQPIFTAGTMPGAPLSKDAYEYISEQIREGVCKHADELAGVMLPLHGAMVPEHMFDGEGPLLAKIREVVGPDVPISVSLDLHANVTQKMVDEADALVGYKTYPHKDHAETGRHAMNILINTMRGGIDPVIHYERPPQIIYQPKAYTPSGPMAEIIERARDHETREGVLAVSVFPGYYHADIPEMGVTTPVVTDGDPALAEEISRDLAETLWTRREEFVDEYLGPDEAVTEAKALAAELTDEGPVVMGDFGSNPGGGGASDGTTILRAMIEQEVENAGYAIMCDAETVDACLDTGVGGQTTVTLGGKTDDQHGERIEDLDVYVKAIADGDYSSSGISSAAGIEGEIDPHVHIQFGSGYDVNAIVSRRRHSAFNPEVWRHVGIQPEQLDVLCIPSFIAFLGGYEPFSGSIVLADTPGVSAVNPARFDYQHIPRPLFPLDDLPDDYYPDES